MQRPGDARAAPQGDRDGQHAVQPDRRPASAARPSKLVVQGVDRPPGPARQYVGKSLGQIAEEEGKHYIDVMLDLSLDDRPQDRVPR